MSPERLTVRAMLSNLSVPLAPPPTLRLARPPDDGTFTSIVTVAPSAIVTWSPAAGTTPPTHVVVELQFPPAPVLVMGVPHADELVPTNQKTAATIKLNFLTTPSGCWQNVDLCIRRSDETGKNVSVAPFLFICGAP